MQSPLVFAILAHDHRDCLADQVANIAALAPGSLVLVFNGGLDSTLTSGLPVRTCPYSRPLVHHYLGVFQGLIMQWLSDERADFEYLITLDSDMLLMKPGLLDHLRASMGGAGYMGAHLGEILPDTPWRPGRRFHRKWTGEWQSMFGLPHPFRAFNPGQVFSKTYVDRFARWPQRSRLLAAIERTRLDALEEIVWASLAHTLGVMAVPHPGGRALQLRRHSPAEIAEYIDDPAVFLLHRVGMNLDAVERQIMRASAAGDRLDIASLPYSYATEIAVAPAHRAMAAYVKDLYQALAPATRRDR